MNKKLSYNITENITAYNNIDIDLGLSFDPLSYVVDMPDNMKKYINENMLLMNIEDVDSIYNIFDHRRVSYAYQMSNMLFINSDQNIFPLNYNLETLSYFTVSYNNIGLNLMPKSLVGVNNFNHQTIFAYNSPNNSYIYSNDDKLVSISYVSQGVYKIDEDNIKLVNNDLSINTTKYKYNHSNINTFINKTNNVIKQYDNNEGISLSSEYIRIKSIEDQLDKIENIYVKWNNDIYKSVRRENGQWKDEEENAYTYYRIIVTDDESYNHIVYSSYSSDIPDNIADLSNILSSTYGYYENVTNNKVPYWYITKILEVTDKNVSIKKKTLIETNNNINYYGSIDINIKDTNYFIIDIPVIYEYETHINNSLEYNRRLCPINIHNNIDINILDIYYDSNKLVDFTNKKLTNEVFFTTSQKPGNNIFSKVYIQFLDTDTIRIRMGISSTEANFVDPYFLYYISKDEQGNEIKNIIGCNYRTSSLSNNYISQLKTTLINYIYDVLISTDNYDVTQIDKNNGVPVLYVISNIFNNYISIDYNKSFIHNNKCLSIKFDENGKATMKDSCNVSLYFNVDTDIYDYVYNLENILDNQFNISIKFELFNLIFNVNCWIDVMNKLFKNLYHNYNYGFNFDKHGKCVGLLILPKSSDSLITTKSENDTIDKVNENREKRGDYTKSKFKKKDLSDINYINVNNSYINLFSSNYNSSILTKNKVKNVNKDIFINFDLESFENVFMTNQKIDFNFSNESKLGETETFDRILTFDYNNITHGLFENPGTLKYPEQLKKRDLNFIYKNESNNPTLYKYNNESNLYLNTAFLDTRYGTLKLSECITKDENNNNDTYKIINNYFVLDYKKHDIIFNDVYNYRKIGFLKGDFYTPCVQDYLLMNLFNVKNYLTYNIYKKYVKYFNENSVRFLTNQFKEKNGQIFQYVLDVNNVDEYRLNFYYDREGDDPTKKKCIWPIFRIPDYSVINSNDYIIVYSDKENCEYIDYYISTLERTTIIYINCRVYFKTNNLNLSNFEIYNEDFEKITYIKITEANLIDRNNDIYQLSIYIEPSNSEISVIEKMNKFYICFKDSEPYLNHKKINDDTYRRILCKVYVKNDGI